MNTGQTQKLSRVHMGPWNPWKFVNLKKKKSRPWKVLENKHTEIQILESAWIYFVQKKIHIIPSSLLMCYFNYYYDGTSKFHKTHRVQ